MTTAETKTWLLVLGFTTISVSVYLAIPNSRQPIGLDGPDSSSIKHRIVNIHPIQDTPLPGQFRVTRVHDGDTCELVGADGIRFTVRFAGIDAPELAQEYGHAAKDTLVELIADKFVTLSEISKDKYGRYLAQVYREGKSINREMISRGAAWTYLAGRHLDEFTQVEAQSRAAKIGLWASGHPTPPWEARK